MGDHYEGRIHWQKILKLLREEENNTLSLRALCDKLDVPHGNSEVEKTVHQLVDQDKVIVLIGFDEKYGVCKVASIKKDETLDPAEDEW